MYNHTFPGEHTVSGLARFHRRFYQNNADYPTYEESWSARAVYDYQGRYMVEGTLGISGSARLSLLRLLLLALLPFLTHVRKSFL
jgi:hypothetical protein